MQIIKHDKFKITLVKNNFVSLEIKEGETIEVDDIHKIYAGYEQLVGENEYVVAVYANPFSSISKKAREIAATKYYSPKRKKVAFISNNLAHVLIMNFFIRINKPKTVIKIFKNEANARSWLLSKNS